MDIFFRPKLDWYVRILSGIYRILGLNQIEIVVD